MALGKYTMAVGIFQPSICSEMTAGNFSDSNLWAGVSYPPVCTCMLVVGKLQQSKAASILTTENFQPSFWKKMTARKFQPSLSNSK
jgi:hypothetical protein